MHAGYDRRDYDPLRCRAIVLDYADGDGSQMGDSLRLHLREFGSFVLVVLSPYYQ